MAIIDQMWEVGQKILPCAIKDQKAFNLRKNQTRGRVGGLRPHEASREARGQHFWSHFGPQASFNLTAGLGLSLTWGLLRPHKVLRRTHEDICEDFLLTSKIQYIVYGPIFTKFREWVGLCILYKYLVSYVLIKSSWGLWDVLKPHYEDFAKPVSLASWGRGHHCWVLGLAAEDFHLSSCPTLTRGSSNENAHMSHLLRVDGVENSLKNLTLTLWPWPWKVHWKYTEMLHFDLNLVTLALTLVT